MLFRSGGSVTTQVRYGEKVYSPIIGKGQADVLVSFETMETPKWIDFIKPDGRAIINEYEIPSAVILSGAADYPQGVIEDISSKVNTTVFKAAELAEGLGNIKTMNVIIVGALVKALGLENIVDWNEVIKETVKEKFIDINVKAFNIGLEQVK